MAKEKSTDGVARSENAENDEQKEVSQRESMPHTYTGRQRLERMGAKEGIARYVVSELIESGTAIFLDAGSTVQAVAREIFSSRQKRSLTIMTNNMGIFGDFNTQLGEGGPDPQLALTLILTGGLYDRDHDALLGTQAASALEDFYPHVVVIGTSGLKFGEDSGVFYHGHTPEEVVKKAILKKPAIRRIIVCDYSKVGRWDSFQCGKVEELSYNVEECFIVTGTVPDKPPDGRSKRYYEDLFMNERAQMNRVMKSNKEFAKTVRFIRVDTEGKLA